MKEFVDVEIFKNKILNMEKDNAIELAVNEYFNGNVVKINGKPFDIMQYGMQ